MEPYHGAQTSAAAIAAITVSVAIAICITAVATTTIICYFNKNCFLYQQRKKTAYSY